MRTSAEYLERFRELFFDAVASRVATREHTGILMSGGFDSTSVAAVAAALFCKQPDALPPIRIYSTLFGGLPCDETPRIRLVQRSLPFPCSNNTPEDRALTTQEIGESMLAVDWHYHVDLLRRERGMGLAGALSKIARIEQIPIRSAAAMVLRQSLPSWLRRSHWRARLRRGPNDTVRSVLEPELWPVAARLARHRVSAPVGYDSHSSEVRWRTINDTRCQRAHAWWNREFKAAGLRLAAPFRDRRLFELVLGTPSRLHPRTFDVGAYKPLITCGLGALLAPDITSSCWKVDFNAYERQVLAASHAHFSDYLFGYGEWRSAAFVSQSRVEFANDRLRAALPAFERTILGDPP